MTKLNWDRVRREERERHPDELFKAPATIIARFSGRCPNCKLPFVAGKTVISKNLNGKWVHARGCPRKKRR